MDIRPTGNIVQSGLSVPDRAVVDTSGSTESVATPAVAVAPAAVQQPDPAAHMAQVTQAIKDINKSMEGLSQGLEFSVDKDTNETVVKVIDQETKEVIRQMPTKEALEIAKALDQVQGLLIKQKA
ncbi:MAG TPA: flagellar protein FlaG [Burkholderiaceae bacterium]|jgi:flagellar protein FlaG